MALIGALCLLALAVQTCHALQLSPWGPSGRPVATSVGHGATEPGFFVNETVPSIPLIVKSPYLQSWLPVGLGKAKLAGKWSQFWDGQQQGWTGFIRVDGKTYTFLGNPAAYGQNTADQTSYQISATRSVFSFSAGPVSLDATFLSPVYLDDPLKQSVPFGYLDLSVRSKDHQEHDVQLYVDIAGDWLSSDLERPIYWETRREQGLIWHTAEAFASQTFDEHDDKIMSGQIVLAARDSDRVTYRTGSDRLVRRMFVNHGTLDDAQDTKFRRIGQDWPVLALAESFKVDISNERRITFALGHVRDPAISYRPTVLDPAEDLSLLYRTKYDTMDALLHFVFSEYTAATKQAAYLDKRIYDDAVKVSHDYALICALSLRQTLAAVELTHSSKHGIQAWVKEISSDGNLNTVDILYPAAPLFLYLAPEYLVWMMDPVLKYQNSGPTYEACAHDLGMHYPYATGPSDGSDSHMPVEESGNILILVLAHAQATGDMSLLKSYYPLFHRWTTYLLRKGLIPEEQLSTDDFMGSIANQSSLALKGGIGIYAMSHIAELVGQDPRLYRKAARMYLKAWQRLATSKEKTRHLTLSYHNESSWMLAYNLYAERLLGFNIIPKYVRDRQDAFYGSKRHKYGIPLDSRRTQTKTDWLLWAAAASNSESVSRMLLQGVVDHVHSGKTDAPFTDWYDTRDGKTPGFRARPVVGGHFSFLALQAMHERRGQRSAN